MSGKNVEDEPDEYKVYLVPKENVNVALASEGAVIKSGNGSGALDGNFEAESGYSEHLISEENTNPGITIRLRHPTLLNRLRFRLWDTEIERYYSYYVQVSVDNNEWIRICDHTKFNCRSWQYIVFPRMLVRYIRIVGTFNSINQWFHVVFLKAYLSETVQKLDQTWEPAMGILAPTSNVATPARGARAFGGMRPEFLLNGEFTNLQDERYAEHKIGDGGIFVQLSQPFVISSLRLLLWDLDDRKYGFEIYVSADRCSWKKVCSRSDQSPWQIIEFEDPLLVVYINIRGTGSTAGEHFHVVHFECPSSVNSDIKAIGPPKQNSQ